MAVLGLFPQSSRQERPAFGARQLVDRSAPRPTLTAGQVCMGNPLPPG